MINLMNYNLSVEDIHSIESLTESISYTLSESWTDHSFTDTREDFQAYVKNINENVAHEPYSDFVVSFVFDKIIPDLKVEKGE